MAGEAAGIGVAALVPEDIDEDAIAALGVQPLDRLRKETLLVHEPLPRVSHCPIAEFGPLRPVAKVTSGAPFF
jgi:hypothetical protein